jgi:hypothetical protein
MADLTQFDIASAQRIARVVRAVENTPPQTQPLRFRRVLQDAPDKNVRIGTFDGGWALNATKTVTFKYQPNTPNTATVLNLFFPVTSDGTKDCAIAKEGTSWFLIDVPFVTATAIFIGASSNKQIVESISASGSINSSCQVVIQLTTVTATVSIVSSTYTSTFLRFQ